jgi:hypothetical protein
MKHALSLLVAALALFADASLFNTAKAQITENPSPQACQWNYSMISGVATATYCGNVYAFNTSPVVHTNAAMNALSTEGLTSVVKDGVTAEGDMIPTLYIAAASCPWSSGIDNGACFTSADGKVWKLAPQTSVPSSVYGIDATGATNAQPKFQLICAAMRAGAFNNVTVASGVYMISATVDCTGTRAQGAGQNWTWNFQDGAIFKASPALSTSMLKIFCLTTQTCTLTIINPNMDASLGTCPVVGCQDGEGLTTIEVQDQLQVNIYNPILTGGTSYTNINSNNGITTDRIGITQVTGGHIQGFPNGGIYSVGDVVANSPPSYRTTVVGVDFTHNGLGVECKFSLDICSVTGSTFDYNRYALGSFVAGATNNEPAARNINWVGNTIRHSQTHGMNVDESTKGVIANNVMIDIGYSETNVLTNSGTEFLLFRGSSGIIVSNNVMKMKDWANSSFIGMTIGNFTFNSVLFTSGGIVGSGNIVSNISTGVYEGAAVNPSQLGMTTDATVTNVAQLTNAGSRIALTNTYTAGGLPGCGSTFKGISANVSDSSNTTFWAVIASGGANPMKVVCDGTSWRTAGAY